MRADEKKHPQYSASSDASRRGYRKISFEHGIGLKKIKENMFSKLDGVQDNGRKQGDGKVRRRRRRRKKLQHTLIERNISVIFMLASKDYLVIKALN